MFEKKQIIYSETQGVCQVENIVSLSASRRERKIPYYVLRPVFDKSRVSYIPVENCGSCLPGKRQRHFRERKK